MIEFNKAQAIELLERDLAGFGIHKSILNLDLQNSVKVFGCLKDLVLTRESPIFKFDPYRSNE